MSKMTFEYRVGDELPSIPLDWLDDDGTVENLSSGWTASVLVMWAGAPNDLVHTMTGVTLAATSPNYTITPSTTDWASVVTGYGSALPTYGTYFILEPKKRRTSDTADQGWKGPRIVVLLKPAIA